MEATVNINVKVSLEEAAIQRIREILVPRPAGIEARPAQGPRPAVPEKPQARHPPMAQSKPRTRVGDMAPPFRPRVVCENAFYQVGGF